MNTGKNADSPHHRRARDSAGSLGAMLRFLTLGIFWALALGAALTTRSAESNFTAAVTQVAPGIWRIHLGQPEALTPLHFRSAPLAIGGLASLPGTGELPLAIDQLAFHVSAYGCAVELPMSADEGIYGFGLNTLLFDMTRTTDGNTGRRVMLKPSDHPENDLGESHAPVPFYVSTMGYGVFVDTARFASFYVGNVTPARFNETSGGIEPATGTAQLYRARSGSVKTMLVQIPGAKGVDLYFFAGPTMLDAVERYNLFSGGGCVPPLWGLGVQYRGFAGFGADESVALAKEFRADNMPCDVWGVEPGWQTRTYSSSFVWNTNRFPDPDGFIQAMHGLGYRLNFWQHAFTHPDSPMYMSLKPWSGNYLVWGGLVPDFATPGGRTVFLKQNDAVLFSKGVDAVKLDECDDQPESATPWSFPSGSVFPSGLDGEKMHSLFGVLYQQTMLKHYAEKSIRTWGLVRNSQALAAPLPYVVYSDSYDHRCYVRGLVNEGFSGLLWTPEVRDADSVEDLYRRIETVVFSPDTLINCWYMKNPPWEQIDKEKSNRNEFMPAREKLTGGIRKLLQLRMSFVPYLYSAFNEYHLHGRPPVRALILDWPSDAEARSIDDQYMFGNSVMVAPMFAGQTNRSVYLPSGDWYDFWNHQKYAGGQRIESTNDETEIPLFVKGGSLLPLAQPVEHIDSNTVFDVTVQAFGVQPADFILYEDDGVSTAYATGGQNQIHLHWDGHEPSIDRTGDYKGLPRYRNIAWHAFAPD
jgi:alpha-D-xyloside xylohydrolase